MKTFKKGTLTTIVDDDDHRIKAYRESGWSEATFNPQVQLDTVDKMLKNAIKDATISELTKHTSKKSKGVTPPDRKINEAIKANAVAAVESVAVDDGLTAQKEGK